MTLKIRNWPKVGTVAGIIIIALMVALLFGGVAANVYWWAWFNLPLYMLHQFEEYVYPGKFRETMNAILTHGKSEDVPLTENHAFVINVAFVWGATIVFNLLGAFSLAFPLVMITMTTVNGFTHIGAAVARRKYNPGLVFSIVLNIPYGFVMIAWIAGIVSSVALALGIIFGIVYHLMVFVFMGIIRKRMSSNTSNSQ
ncbi:MAG TPA: HXXEE domain-containing protein [Candidatus Lokiarchaeia archaeon]|nr:HXXEE domain-containing protein [Candidatus Lokiarchaeia archaeon]